MKQNARAAVLIEKDGKYLLGQEAAPIIYGLWNWQQGKIEEGEKPETAAIRETKEETGLDVSLVRKLTVIEKPFLGTKETHVFLGKIIGDELSFSKDEILDLKWFTKEEILHLKDKLTGHWVLDVINSIE